MTDSNPFLHFWRLGYTSLIPITPPGAVASARSSLAKRPKALGKAPGVKSNGYWTSFDWQNCIARPEDLVRWHLMGAGVGLKLGGRLNLIAIDIDAPDGPQSVRLSELAEKYLGFARPKFGNNPKHTLIYRLADGESAPYQRVEFDDASGTSPRARVELLAEGRQTVIHGIHPGTLKPYFWPAGTTPADELTVVTRQQLADFFAAVAADPLFPAPKQQGDAVASDKAAVDQQALRGNLDDVRRAVAALPNTAAAFPGYDDYIRIGAAIKGATQEAPDVGLGLYLEWAERWDGGENGPETVEADWNRIHAPFRIGAQYLFEVAESHAGQAVFDRALTILKPIEGETLGPEIAAAEDAAIAAASAKYVFMLPQERAALALDSGSRPLIKGLLDQGAMTVLYGESNSGKTFLALAAAWAVATGEPFGDLPTVQRPVVYIVAEGGRGIAKRVAALLAKCPDKYADAPLLTLTSPVDLLDPKADLGPLTKALLKLTPRPGLIIIDTLSRAMAGGDENSSTDMGALVKHLDLIRAATEAHVLVVHHTGKDRAKGARGHSLLRAATDTEIEVADNVISVTKQRDLDKRWSSSFALDPVTIGINQDGEPVTSCVVRLLGDVPPETTAIVQGRDAGKQTAVMDAIHTLGRDTVGGTGVVRSADLLTYMQSAVDATMTKQSLNWLLTALLSKGLIARPSRGSLYSTQPVQPTDIPDIFE